MSWICIRRFVPAVTLDRLDSQPDETIDLNVFERDCRNTISTCRENFKERCLVFNDTIFFLLGENWHEDKEIEKLY